MTLGKALALGLVAVLGACSPSSEVEDDVDDRDMVPPGGGPGDVSVGDDVDPIDLDVMVPGARNVGGVTGMAYRDQDGQRIPIEGARAVLMTPAGTMIYETDITGVFRFDVPPDDYMLLVEAEGFWGIQREIVVPDEGLHGFGWEMSIEDVDIQELSARVNLPFDRSSGIVSAWFTGAAGGETMQLTVGSDPPVTFDANGLPVVSKELLAGGTPMMIFGDVDTGQVRVDVQSNGDSSVCRVDQAPTGYWLSLPHVVTYVTVKCDIGL